MASTFSELLYRTILLYRPANFFRFLRRLPSFWILRHVPFVRADVSEERIASVITGTTVGELGTTLAVTSNRNTLRRNLLVTANVVPSSLVLVTLMVEAKHSSETLLLTRAILCNIPDDGILHSHRRENLRSYIFKSLFWVIPHVMLM
jgi:hypothetical protein